LRNAQQLFGYDAILLHLDCTLEAEACGVDIVWEDDEPVPRRAQNVAAQFMQADPQAVLSAGRLPCVLEAGKRLGIEAQGAYKVLGAITGPLTLCELLQGDDFLASLAAEEDAALDLLDAAVRLANKLIDAYCAAGVDGIALVESPRGRVAAPAIECFCDATGSLWNITRHYDRCGLLFWLSALPENAGALCSLPAHGIHLSGAANQPELREANMAGGAAWGIDIPFDLIGESEDAPPSPLPQAQDVHPCFLTTASEIPRSFPPERLHDLMGRLDGAAG
jgi:hypothetical protein